MIKKQNKTLVFGITMLVAFIVWTVVVRFVDVDAVGPLNSSVGLATLNGYIHNLVGVNMTLYTITDWLGLVPIGVVLLFATQGVIQLIKRKSLFKVDKDLLILGGYYVVVMAVYLLFEYVVINYRPVLIEGMLEGSYPSSTTMLVMSVMPTAILRANLQLKNKAVKRGITIAVTVFVAFMVIGRLVSGVHWITDIIGGALVSLSLVMIYHALTIIKKD